MSDVPISEHALLSDCRSAALVTNGGSVDWLCLPRFDSPPILSRLLDHSAGHFLIAPAAAGWTSTWRYLPHSLVLETTWSGPDGELVVTDAMALGRRERGHQVGHGSPGVLLRQAHCTRGSVPTRVEYVPRPEFGLIHPRFDRSDRAVVTYGGSHVLTLSTDLDLDLQNDAATALVTLTSGEKLAFALEQSSAWEPKPAPWRERKIRRRLTSTEKSWRSWSKLHQHYDGPLRDLVNRSGIVLRGLTFAPSGAMVAAATTSIPEGVGTGRTWDYRFTWVRDAA